MDLYSDDESYDSYWNDNDEDEIQSMGKFRDPAYVNNGDGTFVTEAQLHFFLNREGGQKAFNDATNEFLDYETVCVIHNLIYDASEKDNTEGYMYWNSNGWIDYHIPKNGRVHRMLEKAGLHLTYPDDV